MHGVCQHLIRWAPQITGPTCRYKLRSSLNLGQHARSCASGDEELLAPSCSRARYWFSLVNEPCLQYGSTKSAILAMILRSGNQTTPLHTNK
jgi:hypothetical protein